MSVFVVAAVVASVGAFSTDWSDEFDYETHIDEDQLFKLYWTSNVDGEENTIDIGIEANATGWIALGISPRGTMPNSDIAIGWVDDEGAVFVQDRYTEGRSAPLYDDEQSLELIEGEESDGMTRIRFKRTKYLCEEGHDLSLGDGTTRLIWAFHATEDPSQEMWDANSIKFHTNKGSQSINFESGVADHAELPDDVQFLDFTMDAVAVPASDTTYWCKLMKLPDTIANSTRYVLRNSAIIQEGHEALVHHILAYVCDPDDEDNDWEGVCTDPNMPSKHCRFLNIIFSWAIGGNDWAFPEGTHMELDKLGGFIFLEIHYDNPGLRTDYVDSSGFRMFFTDTPQAMEVAIGSLAAVAFGDGLGQWIPGGLPFAHAASVFMPSECSEYLPDEGIQVFATNLHQHTIGTAISLRHFRDGVELEPLDENMDYDFNFQQQIYHDPPITILPGDSLILDCYTDSSNRSEVTVAGESSSQEMCTGGFLYYPADADGRLIGSVVYKTNDALVQWASDAKDAGYLTGDVEAIRDAYLDEMGYGHNFPDLEYDSKANGAAEFYERLWSTDYPQYNEHNVVCFDGHFLADEPRFDDYEPFVAPTYCEESEDGEEDVEKAKDDDVVSSWWIWLLVALGLVVVVGVSSWAIRKFVMMKAIGNVPSSDQSDDENSVSEENTEVVNDTEDEALIN